MACISKISNAIPYDCDSGSTGLISALLINKEDIASIVLAGSLVSAITLKKGASAYKIDTVKRVLAVSEALKINEGAPNAFTHSATLVLTSSVAGTPARASALLDTIVNPSANGSFVILTLAPSLIAASGSVARVYGLYYGMSATAVDRSTHDNGAWYTITMATPERVIGEDALSLDEATYSTMYSTAVG